MKRVIFYIDGFNLYYGIKSKSWKHYYWLDVARLAEGLLKPDQTLVAARYFTSNIVPTGADGANKKKRQDTYLEALAAHPKVHIHYGLYVERERHCRVCGASWLSYEEKMTHVNIAVKILGDAGDDKFDTAVIVSGDSDLTGPIEEVRARYPDKRVVVAFPPNRHADSLKIAADAYFTIGRNALRDSQFPDTVVKPDGYPLSRPDRWR